MIVDRAMRLSRRARIATLRPPACKAVLEGIREIGCLVKDLDMGLVDFPTCFSGQEVYLCWKLGEPDDRILAWSG